MKRVIALIALFVLASFVFLGQAIDYTRKLCDCCGGGKGYYTGYNDYYGNPIFAPCQCCQGLGYILVPTNSNSPSFEGSRLVSLRSEHGGKTYATGTFYEGKMVVHTTGGVYLNVSYSDSNKWKYMILFNNGQKWYFD